MSRKIELVINAQDASDGAGVKLKRVFNSHYYQYTNPFVMLDEFGSAEASDYIAGFPFHPHRGFDTITFMLKGKMTHKDSLGNQGVISDNQVQWMSTGRGIIHSEMPAQTAGEMCGMQFWLNVPKAMKRLPAAYLDYDTPAGITESGNTFQVIAGHYLGKKTPLQPEATNPFILYLVFNESEIDTITVPEFHNIMLYVMRGKVMVGDSLIKAQQLAMTSKDSSIITFHALKHSRIILFGGLPIHEPMVQHGPFVMNNIDEIRQAFDDYKQGILG